MRGQELPVKSNYYYSKTLFNPAYTGNCKIFKSTLLHRSQWVGIKDAPAIQILSIHHGFDQNFGVGGYFYNDKNGLNSKLGGQISFAYHINLYPEYEANKSKLSFGIGIISNQYSLDESKFSQGKFDPSVTRAKQNSFSQNFEFGILYKYNKYYLGASVTNVIEETIGIYDNGYEEPLPTYLFIETGTVFRYKFYNFEPIFVTSTKGNGFFNFDLGIKATMHTYTDDKYRLSLLYKSNVIKEKYNNIALSTVFEYNIRNYGIGYTLDFTLTNIRNYSYGSHTIFISYKFPYKSKCKCNNDFTRHNW